jgi:hypothetical protein
VLRWLVVTVVFVPVQYCALTVGQERCDDDDDDALVYYYYLISFLLTVFVRVRW